MEALTTAGTYAQYAVVSESVLGLKPKSLSHLARKPKPRALNALDYRVLGFFCFILVLQYPTFKLVEFLYLSSNWKG